MKKLLFTAAILMALFTLTKAAEKESTIIFHHIIHKADEGISIKLVLGNKTYDVISYNLNFTATDKEKSTPITTNGFSYMNQSNTIGITIRSSKIDQDFMNWLLSDNAEPKDGQLIITDNENGKLLKTITLTVLKSAFYNESMYNNGPMNNNIQATTNFTLRFKTVSIKL